MEHSKEGIHLNIEKTLAYITDEMEEGDAFILEAHIADCDECAQKVYQYNYIKENFDEIWDSLSVGHIARELFELRLLESLVDANLKPDFLKRIQSWAKDFFEKTQIVMGIVVDASKKTAKIVEDGLEALSRAGKIPCFVPVGRAVHTLGDGVEDAIRHQERRGPHGEKIDIYFSKNIIQFKIRPLALETPPPLLWLFPKTQGPSIIKATHQPLETDYLTAEFSIDELTNLNDYIIFLEYQPTGTH